jgi:hypothetical protein
MQVEAAGALNVEDTSEQTSRRETSISRDEDGSGDSGCPTPDSKSIYGCIEENAPSGHHKPGRGEASQQCAARPKDRNGNDGVSSNVYLVQDKYRERERR